MIDYKIFWLNITRKRAHLYNKHFLLAKKHNNNIYTNVFTGNKSNEDIKNKAKYVKISDVNFEGENKDQFLKIDNVVKFPLSAESDGTLLSTKFGDNYLKNHEQSLVEKNSINLGIEQDPHKLEIVSKDDHKLINVHSENNNFDINID